MYVTIRCTGTLGFGLGERTSYLVRYYTELNQAAAEQRWLLIIAPTRPISTSSQVFGRVGTLFTLYGLLLVLPVVHLLIPCMQPNSPVTMARRKLADLETDAESSVHIIRANENRNKNHLPWDDTTSSSAIVEII